MSVSMPDSVSTAPVEPTPRLYTGGQVAVATLLGGPVGGGWLIRANCRRLDQPERGRLVISCSIAATLALFAWGILIPAQANLSRLIAPMTAAFMHQLARVMFAGRFGPAQPIESWWRAIGVSLAVMVVTLATAWLLVTAASNGPPWLSDPINDRITVGPDQEIEYTAGATREDGARLAGFVRTHQVLADTPASLGLSGPYGHRRLLIPFGPDHWDDPETIAWVTDLGREVHRELFARESLTVQMTDVRGNPRRSIVFAP